MLGAEEEQTGGVGGGDVGVVAVRVGRGGDAEGGGEDGGARELVVGDGDAGARREDALRLLVLHHLRDSGEYGPPLLRRRRHG